MLQHSLCCTFCSVRTKSDRKMGKPKLACEDCGLDYQSKAARIISYNKLVADIKDGMYPDELVSRPVKAPSGGLDVVRIMQEELTKEAAKMVPKKYLDLAIMFPELFVPGLRTLIAHNIAVVTSVFDGLSVPDLDIPHAETKDDNAVHKYTPRRSHKTEHDNSKVQLDVKDSPKNDRQNMTPSESLRETMESMRKENGLKNKMEDRVLRERARISMEGLLKKWAARSETE